MGDFELKCGDAIESMRGITCRRPSLTFFSPQYENQRSYGGLSARTGQAWVDWMVEVFRAATSVTDGLVAAVVQGNTRDFRWSATPALLIADLHRAGFHVRNPAIYERGGIAGSGGPDWLKSRYEWVVCVAPPGRLPWSNNVACGRPPKFKPGGAMSHQSRDGRVNKPRPQLEAGGVRRVRTYKPPELSNPGNIIDCGSGGGGHLGHPLAHENEAPFPLKLAEFFVKSFCRPGGTVCDPFMGSGSAGHAAIINGRNFIGFDVRESQIDLTRRRLEDVRSKGVAVE